MLKKLLRSAPPQKGQILVLSALLLPFMIAVLGLAIEIGNLYIHQTKLQNLTDAMALAGSDNAKSMIPNKNNFNLWTGESEDILVVQLEHEIEPIFFKEHDGKPIFFKETISEFMTLKAYSVADFSGEKPKLISDSSISEKPELVQYKP